MRHDVEILANADDFNLGASFPFSFLPTTVLGLPRRDYNRNWDHNSKSIVATNNSRECTMQSKQNSEVIAKVKI